MDPKLPGLVTMSSIPSDALGHEALSAGVYKNLWQAYTISRRTSKDDTEHRLEQLFWRIWSDRGLSKQMNPRTLDRLILRIKFPEDLVGQETADPIPEGIKEKSIEQPRPCDTGSCGIHSILKKKPPTAQPAQAPEGESHKSTRLLLDTSIGTKITLDPSDSPIALKSPTAIPDPRPASKKSYLTATRTGRGPRRRPVFNRRKSSQTSIPKSPNAAIGTATPRRRSEPAAKTDGSDAMYEDSYVELGLLQHLSFRDEEDQIARDLGREIAPEPKPVKPSVPLFDEVDDDILPVPGATTSAVLFPPASPLKNSAPSPDIFNRVNDVDVPGGPDIELDGVEGDWSDVDAIDSTLPISQPFKNLVEHREHITGAVPAVHPDLIPAVIPVDKHVPLMPPSMEGVKL